MVTEWDLASVQKQLPIIYSTNTGALHQPHQPKIDVSLLASGLGMNTDVLSNEVIAAIRKWNKGKRQDMTRLISTQLKH